MEKAIGISRSAEHELYRIKDTDLLSIPFYTGYIAAGFPSPAGDYLEENINLCDLLVRNPESTFLMRARGRSMVDANIQDGDILVIDRSIKPEDGRMAACYLDDGWTVKFIRRRAGKLYLKAANTVFPDIEIKEEMDFRVWGIITFIIHKARAI